MVGKQGSAGTVRWDSYIDFIRICVSFHHGSLRVVGFLTWCLRIQNMVFYELLLGRQIASLLTYSFSQSSGSPTQIKGEGTRTPPKVGGYWKIMAVFSYCLTYYCLSLLFSAFHHTRFLSVLETHCLILNSEFLYFFVLSDVNSLLPDDCMIGSFSEFGLSIYSQGTGWLWNFAASEKALIAPSRDKGLNSVPSQHVLTSSCGVRVLTSAAWS